MPNTLTTEQGQTANDVAYWVVDDMYGCDEMSDPAALKYWLLQRLTKGSSMTSYKNIHSCSTMLQDALLRPLGWGLHGKL